MFSLIYVWINGWVNRRDTGDLKRYRAHYDVIEMSMLKPYAMIEAYITWPRCNPSKVQPTRKDVIHIAFSLIVWYLSEPLPENGPRTILGK